MEFTQDLVSALGSTIKNLPTPEEDGDAAPKSYVDAAIEGLAWKDNCRVSTTSNINLLSPGAAINGISLDPEDRVLVRYQTTQSENGIYLFVSDSQPMIRAADADTADSLENAITTVDEGSSAGSSFRQTQLNFTINSGNVIWTSFGVAASPASESSAGVAEIATQGEVDAGTDNERYITPSKLANWSGRSKSAEAVIGDGSATLYSITHNFGTKAVCVHVYYVSNDEEFMCDKFAYSDNVVKVEFKTAPASDSVRVVIKT